VHVRIDVLGTPSVSGEGGVVSGLRLGGRRVHVVLVALALERGTVPAERLAMMVWPSDPPPTWRAALRGVVRELRAALAPIDGGQQAIMTEPPGYRLAAGVEVDAAAAAGAVQQAAGLLRQGRFRAALNLAEPVSRLSGGQILPDDDGAWLRAHRAAVDAVARQATELVADAAASLGEHAVAVAAARGAVLAYPLDERAYRCLIRALDRAGDRAGAVRAFEECRAGLAEHLGVDPSAETVQIYLAALSGQAPTSPARIPAQTASFVGREPEVTQLGRLIADPGLVTVTGLGGVGKSRLAARVAATAAGFDGGRLWVPLGSVAEDALVAATVALAVGVPPGTEDAASAIASYLAPAGRALLVLDGCEVAPDGAASLAAALLAYCPTLTILVTSRIPLRCEHEVPFALSPLPQPGAAAGPSWRTSPAVRLLVDRVCEAGGAISLEDGVAPHILALLRRCAGLPLAVELAAAQLTVIPVGDLLDQLGPLLSDGSDPVRAIAAGSYALLDEQEAAVFRRFGVLDGSAGLALVRQVVSGGSVPPVRVVRILRELTASGLVAVDRVGAQSVYHQADELHRFAREMLQEHGEERAAFDRLAAAILAILPGEAQDPPGPFQDAITSILGSVRSLLAAGLSGRASGTECVELAFRLHRYWAASNVAEGRFWLSRLLARYPDTHWSAYATYALGYLDYWSGDTSRAVTELRAVVSAFEGADNPYAARALIYLAGLLDDLDRGAEAVDCVRHAIRAAAPFGTDLRVAAAMGLGSVLSERGNPEAARYATEAIELCRGGGSAEHLAAALPTAAMVCWQVGVLDRARAFADEAHPLLAGTRRIARVVLLSVSAGLALAEADVTAAVEIGMMADSEGTELGVEREIPLIRAVLARALLAAGDQALAAERAGAAVAAALSLSHSFPLAVALETAVLVLRERHGAAGSDLDRLIAVAAAIRRRGDRPPPATLARQLDARLEAPRSGPPAQSTPAAAGRLALELLAPSARSGSRLPQPG
jgi:predicted ATPase/DNA-binding SARP family transcriptional activator